LIFSPDDGIVVVEVRREHVLEMHVPLALRGRLGTEATSGLLELLDETHKETRERVITACTERFERRLVEEISGVRVQIAQAESSIREDIAAGRIDLFKWSFLFWIGQVLAIGGLVSVMLRLSR
jgi:hypothetical protein